MRTGVIALLLLTMLPACGSGPSTRSAYSSSWSLATSLDAQRQCGVVRLSKGVFVSQNLQLLVERHYLTREQAERVVVQNVLVGDPECVAYAAFGVWQAKNTQRTDRKKRLIQLEVDFSCQNSDVPCPGTRVQVIDGVITSISPL